MLHDDKRNYEAQQNFARGTCTFAKIRSLALKL